jgi:hypothetical protein
MDQEVMFDTREQLKKIQKGLLPGETGMLGGRGVFAGSKLVLSTSVGAYALEFRGADEAHAAHDLILKRMLY